MTKEIYLKVDGVICLPEDADDSDMVENFIGFIEAHNAEFGGSLTIVNDELERIGMKHTIYRGFFRE